MIRKGSTLFVAGVKRPKLELVSRIGILSKSNCSSCDSRIGFGTGGTPDDSNTCGNSVVYLPDNGNKLIKAMGYILVQCHVHVEKKRFFSNINN